nr:acylphosphatase [uncultured Bacillus sp.]
MIQLRIIVSGKVQGVGYRYFSQMKAAQYGIKGWAKNHTDGSVEIIAAGSNEQLEPFIEDLRKGNPFSKINYMEITEMDHADHFPSFTIKY